MRVQRKAGIEPVTMFTAITAEGEIHIHPDPAQDEFEWDSDVAQAAIATGAFEEAASLRLKAVLRNGEKPA